MKEKYTRMNWDRVEGNWKQMKGKAREQWGKLTDSDWDQIAGNAPVSIPAPKGAVIAFRILANGARAFPNRARVQAAHEANSAPR